MTSKLLALDASTDFASIALGYIDYDKQPTIVATISNQGANKSSEFFIDNILTMLRQVNWNISEINYIAFGAGPGSFTGLRTNCSVAQGLAYGINAKVIPINTLHALAQQAWQYLAQQHGIYFANQQIIHACLDARMHEIYHATFSKSATKHWTTSSITISTPEKFVVAPQDFLVGNIFTEYQQYLPSQIQQQNKLVAQPNASAMLQLAPYLIQQNLATTAEHALPMYIRNKVALTTEERLQLKQSPDG